MRYLDRSDNGDGAMKRRWIIRVIFMLPILLCVVGWVWSSTHNGVIDFSRDGRGIELASSYGAVTGVLDLDAEKWHDGWYRTVRPIPGVHFWPEGTFGLRSFLGLTYFSNKAGSNFYIDVPYWFLILIFSAPLFFVWRKTRPLVKGRAFPVEATAQHD